MPETSHASSPTAQVGTDAPPFLVLHGDKDTLAPVEDARLFVERLRAISREPVLYGGLQGAHHAFDLSVSTRAKPVIESVERFLTAVHQQAEEGGPEVPDADIEASGWGDADAEVLTP